MMRLISTFVMTPAHASLEPQLERHRVWSLQFCREKNLDRALGGRLSRLAFAHLINMPTSAKVFLKMFVTVIRDFGKVSHSNSR